MVILSASYIFATGLLPTGCGGSQRSAKEPAKATQEAIARAEGFEAKRQYDRAREAYATAVDGAPDPRSGAYAAQTFASSLAFWGEVAEAVKMLERSVSLDPERASAWHDLGVLRAKLGQFATSETAIRRARQLANDDPRPRIALAALLVKTQRFSEAAAEYELLLELDLPEKTRSAIGRALELLASEGAVPK